MTVSSLVLQKISDLMIEAQTGLKTRSKGVPLSWPVPLNNDSVTISGDGQFLLHLATPPRNASHERTRRVYEIQGLLARGEYTISEEMAEKIARKILSIKD